MVATLQHVSLLELKDLTAINSRNRRVKMKNTYKKKHLGKKKKHINFTKLRTKKKHSKHSFKKKKNNINGHAGKHHEENSYEHS